MAIPQWPEAEQPREKLIRLGAEHLSDAELLAIFLRTGCKGKTAVDLARDLLTEFKGLRPILLASEERFCRVKGLGRAKFTQLQAVLEIARRHLNEQLQQKQVFNCSKDVKSFVVQHLREEPTEVFACLFLDTKHRLISFKKVAHGTIDQAAIYPREVAKMALAQESSAVIFAHNHPSGDTWPSQADHNVTKALKDALALFDIKSLDHLIVGGNDTLSFAEHGWM